MFTLINSLPLWFRILVLEICEVGLIYAIVKKKIGKDGATKVFFILLTALDPVFIIAMVIDSLAVGETMNNFSNMFSLGLSFVFAICLIIVAIIKLKSNKLTVSQKRIITFSLFMLLFCFVSFIVITILEKTQG